MQYRALQNRARGQKEFAKQTKWKKASLSALCQFVFLGGVVGASQRLRGETPVRSQVPPTFPGRTWRRAWGTGALKGADLLGSCLEGVAVVSTITAWGTFVLLFSWWSVGRAGNFGASWGNLGSPGDRIPTQCRRHEINKHMHGTPTSWDCWCFFGYWSVWATDFVPIHMSCLVWWGSRCFLRIGKPGGRDPQAWPMMWGRVLLLTLLMTGRHQRPLDCCFGLHVRTYNAIYYYIWFSP